MSISRYQQKDGNLIYLPTVEACDAFKINRLPTNYSGGTSLAPNSTSLDSVGEDTPTPDYLYQDTPGLPGVSSVGPQFSTFGSSDFVDSLQNLTVPEVNTRDIVIEVLGNSPYTIKTKTTNGITTSEYTYGSGDTTPVYRLSISPTNPGGDPFELEISHEHEWGTQSDIFSSILRSASQLVGNADDFIQKIKQIGNTTSNGNGGFQQLPNRRFDLAETYSSTTKQHIVIPFTLFTPGGTGFGGQENFLRDILDPITLITSFSYPKRQSELGQGVTGQLANIVSKVNNNPNNNGNALDTINALNPGFRVFVAEPPSYVNVYHQGGLFSYKNCYIKKFTYKFKNFVDGAGGSIKDIVTDQDSGVAGILKSISANANLAYPVIAECTLEVATTEPLFSDDFIALSNDRSNASQTTGGLTTVNSFKNEGDANHG